MPLLEVADLRVRFNTRDGVVHAVDGISYALERGQTLGIVGESGSGKSVSCYALLGLIPQPPGEIVSGTAVFDGQDLLRLNASALRRVRGRRIAMIFQDPMTALNPYMTIGAQLMEPLRIHEGIRKGEARARAIEALAAVGIHDGARRLNDHPHQYSGGMRQRVMIAMALIAQPDLIIADEPTTALDVTVQAQILDLIKQIQADFGMAVILVTHDLGVVAGTCDEVLVMYAGRVLERAGVDTLFSKPRHPYTEALLRSLPTTIARTEELYTIPGMPPDLMTPVVACPFTPRCEYAVDYCATDPIALETVAHHHETACLRVQRGEL